MKKPVPFRLSGRRLAAGDVHSEEMILMGAAPLVVAQGGRGGEGLEQFARPGGGVPKGPGRDLDLPGACALLEH